MTGVPFVMLISSHYRIPLANLKQSSFLLLVRRRRFRTVIWFGRAISPSVWLVNRMARSLTEWLFQLSQLLSVAPLLGTVAAYKLANIVYCSPTTAPTAVFQTSKPSSHYYFTSNHERLQRRQKEYDYQLAGLAERQIRSCVQWRYIFLSPCSPTPLLRESATLHDEHNQHAAYHTIPYTINP
ncbi:hypothetical protein JOM56_010666 [Amanita muscaria]